MSPIRFIRVHVFGLTQKQFASIARVGQASVSRWENGQPLNSDEMRAIRDQAAKLQMRWDDRWFFEVPESAGENAAPAASCPAKSPVTFSQAAAR